MNRKCSPEDVRRRREEIDRLDAELLRMLNQRATLALDLAKVKQGLGWEIQDPERERQVLLRVTDSNPGPFDCHGIKRIFRRIICESRRMEKELNHGGRP
jgi:chorismate mutase/prephenate dehydratase